MLRTGSVAAMPYIARLHHLQEEQADFSPIPYRRSPHGWKPVPTWCLMSLCLWRARIFRFVLIFKSPVRRHRLCCTDAMIIHLGQSRNKGSSASDAICSPTSQGKNFCKNFEFYIYGEGVFLPMDYMPTQFLRNSSISVFGSYRSDFNTIPVCLERC